MLDRSRLRNEQPNANQPEIHTDKNTVQSKDDESEKECMFHDIPNTLTLSSDNTFDITFKGLNISDSLSWKCSSGIKIVKAEFEIGPDLLATASFKADNSDGEILLISIVVNYKNKNYIANYIKENNHFILNV